jgi:hypothetical protein
MIWSRLALPGAIQEGVPPLRLAVPPILDLEPVRTIVAIDSRLALGHNALEVASGHFREQFFACALDVLRVEQPLTVARANELREPGLPL